MSTTKRNRNGTIYLVCFNRSLKHAHHYLGFVEGSPDNVPARIEEHRAGWGAKILEACNREGIQYEVVRTFPGTRDRERQIKNTHNLPAYCPICRRKSNQK